MVCRQHISRTEYDALPRQQEADMDLPSFVREAVRVAVFPVAQQWGGLAELPDLDRIRSSLQ